VYTLLARALLERNLSREGGYMPRMSTFALYLHVGGFAIGLLLLTVFGKGTLVRWANSTFLLAPTIVAVVGGAVALYCGYAICSHVGNSSQQRSRSRRRRPIHRRR